MNVSPLVAERETQLILNPSNRLRRSPIFDRVKAAGAKAWSVYNNTLIGQWFTSLEEDYAHLKRAVQVWDVGGERVIEIAGPGARRLLQLATPRDLRKLAPERCAYIPMVDPEGRMLNDPVLVPLGPERFWIALSDGDIHLYLKGLAACSGLDVTVGAPDVWILAIQGPRADALAARLWGGIPGRIPFFGQARVDVGGREMVLARTGFSRQGGFELYVEGAHHLGPVWDRLMAEGADLDVRAGCPNLIERIEGGLLSYGNDMTQAHTPLEAGLGRYCDLDADTGCLAHAALRTARTPARQIRPVEIAGGRVPPVARLWPVSDARGGFAGHVSSAAWSPDHGTNVAIAMLERDHWAPGTELVVQAGDGPRPLIVRAMFWADRPAGGRPT